VVRNASGTKLGYARTGGKAYSSVRHWVLGRDRVKRGWIRYARMDAWLISASRATGARPTAYAQRVGSSGWWMGPNSSDYPAAWEGRIRKRNKRWFVYLKVDGVWRVRGSVTAKCPAWLAGGAVYVLLGKRWR